MRELTKAEEKYLEKRWRKMGDTIMSKINYNFLKKSAMGLSEDEKDQAKDVFNKAIDQAFPLCNTVKGLSNAQLVYLYTKITNDEYFVKEELLDAASLVAYMIIVRLAR